MAGIAFDTAVNTTLCVAGILVIAWILWDVFQTVIVPRPTPTRIRLTRFLTRGMWRLWRFRARHAVNPIAREKMLGSFAPLLVVVLIGLWVTFLILGYGLILFGLRHEIANEPDFPTALYQAGITLLTIGYGDVLAQGLLSRLAEILAAATGLGVMALGITYLFSLYGSFQRREELVTTLDARAGAPPSGVSMLETYAKLGLWDDLRRNLAEWEVWSAQVLDSHVAYPVLVFFRSSHDNESWLSALGAVLDAAVLIVTSVERGPNDQPVPTGQAAMTIRGGDHLVEDLANFLRFPKDSSPMVERPEYDTARERLKRAGLTLRPDADAGWAAFSLLRGSYATRLNEMATYLLTPPTQWIGDRSMLPHRRPVEKLAIKRAAGMSWGAGAAGAGAAGAGAASMAGAASAAAGAAGGAGAGSAGGAGAAGAAAAGATGAAGEAPPPQLLALSHGPIAYLGDADPELSVPVRETEDGSGTGASA